MQPKRFKKLKPSMRQKKRYLVLDTDDSNLVDAKLLETLGVMGYAKASPKRISIEKSKVVLLTNPKSLADVKSALALSGIKCIGVSGTLNKLRKKFIK